MAASFNPASMTSPKPSPRQHRSTGLGSLHRLHRLRRRTASPIKRCCIMCRDLSLDLRHVRERPVPARLQFAREQPISWIGSIVLPKGAVGSVARRFEVAAEGPAHLIPPLARLLLGGCGGGDRAGTDHSQQRILDGVVNTQTTEGDAVRGAIVHPGPAAAVARDAVLGACVLQRQLAPAAVAADQPGEERVAMLRRAVMPAGGTLLLTILRIASALSQLTYPSCAFGISAQSVRQMNKARSTQRRRSRRRGVRCCRTFN